VGIFCFNWTFWWFIAAVIVMFEGAILCLLAAERMLRKAENRAVMAQHLISLGAFLGFTLLWVLVFSGPKPLVELYRQLQLAFILNKPLMASIWPNVYSTVGELRRLNFKETMDAVGGAWIFVPACLMLLGLLIRGIVDRSWEAHKRRAVLLLSVWFLSMLFASSRGIRFVVFMLPPLGIALGWGVHELYLRFRSRYRIYSWLFSAACCILVAWAVIPRGYMSAMRIFPLMDDTWYRVLSLVDEKTPKDTILNSWWDFGDWFKVVGNRRVIFDGQSQDTPQAFWMGKALLSQDEVKAAAILRMLNNGGNKAFEVVNQHVKDELRSVLLLESILGAKPEDAQPLLAEYLPVPAVQQVMGLLYAKPAPAYFVVDPTLQYKMPAISFLGNWDFAKVYIVQNFNKLEKEKILEYLQKLGKDPQEMQQYYQEAFLISRDKLDRWLSRPVQFMGVYSSGREQNGIVTFANGMTFDVRNRMAKSLQGQVPRSIFMMQEGQLVEIPVPGANIDLSVLVTFDQERGWRCMMMSPSLGRSLFTRLYYLKAEGLTRFRPFVDAEEGNNFTRVLAIQW
jgi:dolichyl-phosphooligosaccharide-protein glycotransferase